MKTILCYAPNHLDGISFYRMHGPFSELQKQNKIKIINWENKGLDSFMDWTYFTRSDIAFISRPRYKVDWKFVEVAKKYGLKIWSDFDDDLINIPDDNDVYHSFTSKEAIDSIRYVLSNSDVVSFATSYLERLYIKEFGLKNTIVIPNAVHPTHRLWKKEFNFNNRISWRGTPSHFPEILYHEKDLIDLKLRHPDHEWRYFGINPYTVIRKIPPERRNIKFVKSLNWIDFIHAFSDYNASIQFCVLLDSHFHRAKSNISWIDATLAGSAFLGPNFAEYDRPGIRTYRIMESQSFKNNLDHMLNSSEETLRSQHDLSWEWIRDNILLENVNKSRVNLIENL